jgi:hypothetical protein
MPNWCDNSFMVSHKDPEMIRKFAEGVNNGSLFESLVPLSKGEWDYYVAIEEWGTKWDVSQGYAEIDPDGLGASGSFSTAWSPGIEAYRQLVDLGFQLDILYNEPGVGFAGRFTNEDDDYCVEYNFEDPDWREQITDSEVLETLENEYENWHQWQEEEED